MELGSFRQATVGLCPGKQIGFFRKYRRGLAESVTYGWRKKAEERGGVADIFIVGGESRSHRRFVFAKYSPPARAKLGSFLPVAQEEGEAMTPEGMKELQEALAVTNRIQNRHALLIEDHERWLESQQKWMERTQAWMERTQAWMNRHQEWAEGTQARMDRHQEWAEKAQALIDQTTAVQLANQEWAEKAQALIDQTTAVQLANAEGLSELRATVQAFIDSLRRGGNGRGPGSEL